MSFRVLIAGGRHFTNYPHLRATLDALLANRLPNVELLTVGGPGAAMLTGSYGAERGLAVVALVPDHMKFPARAEERRDADAVALADAVVVVWDGRDPTARRVRALAEARGVPLYLIGASAPRPKADPTAPLTAGPIRGLPD